MRTIGESRVRNNPKLVGGAAHALALCLLILGTSACQVDQAQEVAIYRSVTDLEPAPPQHNAGAPLSLASAMRLANLNNESLAIEGEDYLRAIIERRRIAASFLPTVNLVPVYSQREAVAPGTDSRSTSQDARFDAPAELNYNLFNGFRDVNAAKAQDERIEAQRHDLLHAQESLLLDVAQVYYQVLRAEASMRVLENSVRVQEERLRDTRGRLAAGLGRPLDVSQSEAQLSATRTDLILAQRDVAEGRAVLAFLTAAVVEQSPLIDEFALPEAVPALEELWAKAQKQRDDLAAAAEAVEAARYDVEVAFGQYYPSITLDFTTFLYRESVPEQRTWEALLVANVPIFTAGRIHADVREAWSFYREALLAQEQLQRLAKQDLDVAYQRLAASDARLAEALVQHRAAEAAYLQAEQAYQAGLATNLDRVQAQEDLLQAQLLLASELYDRKLFYLTVVRETGKLREELVQMPAVEIAAADAAAGAGPLAPVPAGAEGPLQLITVPEPSLRQTP